MMLELEAQDEGHLAAVCQQKFSGVEPLERQPSPLN
jgi:hypothetical protein